MGFSTLDLRGAEGPTAISTDADNIATLGTDSLIYVPEGITGTGTDNYLVKWNGTDALQDSVIYDDDTNVGIGESTPTQKLHVNGSARITGAYYDSNNSPGSSGEILSSTATGTDWIPAPSGVAITVEQTIFSTSLKDLVSNPVVMVTTPGGNKIIRVLNASVRVFHGVTSTAYDFTNPLMLEYNTGENILELPTIYTNVAVGGSGTNKFYKMKTPTVGSTNLEVPEDTGIRITTETTDATVGNGAFKVAVTYVIHDLVIGA